MAFPSFVPILAMIVVLIIPVYGQINSPCSASMISSFSPCMSFVNNSSSNGTSPTADCCNSLKSLTSGGMGCLCLILTGNIPFQLPINRTMAISLPRACNMAGVPVQCKGKIVYIPFHWVGLYGTVLSIYGDTNEIFCTFAASATPLPAPGTLSNSYFERSLFLIFVLHNLFFIFYI